MRSSDRNGLGGKNGQYPNVIQIQSVSYHYGTSHHGLSLVGLFHDIEEVFGNICFQVEDFTQPSSKVLHGLYRGSTNQVLVGSIKPLINTSQNTWYVISMLTRKALCLPANASKDSIGKKGLWLVCHTYSNTDQYSPIFWWVLPMISVACAKEMQQECILYFVVDERDLK